MSDAKHGEVARAVCEARGWTLGPEVGSGAFKHTFQIQKAGGELAALKVYRRAGANARTEREVEAITRCSHPNIARFEMLATHQDGADEYVYSLEEFLSGGTLTDRLAAGTIPVPEVIDLGKQLVDAVGHIADLGLVHRDLKPDNIMFRTAGGAPVIVDFGLVRDLGKASLTKTWAAHGPGTPLYSSPEQLRNEKALIDWRSDQFALGVVLTMCARGEHPFRLDGMQNADVVERVERRQSPAPEFVLWAQKNGLGALVKMVAPWPIGRFRTHSQLVAAWPAKGV